MHMEEAMTDWQIFSFSLLLKTHELGSDFSQVTWVYILCNTLYDWAWLERVLLRKVVVAAGAGSC